MKNNEKTTTEQIGYATTQPNQVSTGVNSALLSTGNIACFTISPTTYFIQFNNPTTGEFLGRFYEKDGLLSFEGNVDESAKLFVDQVKNMF